MKEKKLGSYLIYAFGEITLIVVGIMIALQLDNWNENQKQDDEIKITLNSLQEELSDNLESFKTDSARLQRSMNGTRDLYQYFNSEGIINEFTADTLILSAFLYPTWNVSTFVLNEMKFSGMLKEIKNRKLKSLIYRYERQLINVAEWHRFHEAAAFEATKYVRKHGSLANINASTNAFNIQKSKFNRSNLKLLSHPEFENIIDQKYIGSNFVMMEYIDIKSQILKILEETKQYVDVP